MELEVTHSLTAVICPSLSSISETIWEKSQHGRESQVHSVRPSFCAEELHSRKLTRSGDDTTLADAFREVELVLWLHGVMVVVNPDGCVWGQASRQQQNGSGAGK